MAAKKKLLILPGDGIGPEVMREVRRVIEWISLRHGHGFEIEEDLAGGAAIDAHGEPISDDTMAKAKAADAVLLGAVGGPKWDGLPFQKKPERALLRLRKDLGLYANIRPAICFDAMVDASSLKPDVVRGLNIMIVRELTGGIYFGEPKGVEELADGGRRGINTHVYGSDEIQRVARVAYDLARLRDSRVCSVDKANVMESGVLWREEVTKVRDADYQDIQLSHMYADNCAMQLIRFPKQFDVILTDNLFGDLLSDEAAMLTGSLGMLPSASLGDADENGQRRGLFEPVHGSAPDIAGRNRANPLATMLSLSMMLRYSFELTKEADLVDTAVERVLSDGLRTADIMAKGATQVTTSEMGRAVLTQLGRLAD